MRAPVNTGDEVRVSPSGAMSNVKHIWLASAELKKAAPGKSVAFELEDEIGIFRGDIISAASLPVETSE